MRFARALGVTQKTAWFMLQRIRLAMQDENDGGGKLGGDVEVDETYIGGKARNMHTSEAQGADGVASREATAYPSSRRTAGRQGGRDGHAGARRRRHVARPHDARSGIRKHQLAGQVREHVEQGSTVYTDALHSYHGLMGDYEHQVDRPRRAYVRGNVHTNGLESYWWLLKRALRHLHYRRTVSSVPLPR